MKHALLVPLVSVCLLQAKPSFIANSHSNGNDSSTNGYGKVLSLSAQPEDGRTRMPAAVFKAQDFCRAEVKDFDFDAHFSVLGATVYFTGANFKTVEKGIITSSSLKPIKSLMERCVPGSIIIFDEIKVIGPDNHQRIIQPLSIVLY